jgi:hypothetical protein
MKAILAIHFPALVLLLGACGTAAWAAPPAEETIYQSSELRIYRTVNRDGTPIVVLTNVDAEGQFFPGRDERSLAAYSPPPAAPLEARERETKTPVRVVVNRGDGESPAAADDVQVEADGRGGTTVIINIHPPAPPPPQTVVVPAVAGYPIVSYGGLAGPFRYPEHLHFLGYGHGTSAPSYFGGLGLNAGNRFGLKTGVACDRGYDCMFGGTRDHP